MVDSADEYSPDFVAEKVLSDACDVEVSVPTHSYWCGPDATTDATFVLDYGCSIEIAKFQLKNSANNAYGERYCPGSLAPCTMCTRVLSISKRATNAYSIETSLDKSSWFEVASGNLASVFSMACQDFPLVEVTPNGGGTVTARYVKFIAKTYHGSGSGLNYFNVIKKDDKKSTHRTFIQGDFGHMRYCSPLSFFLQSLLIPALLRSPSCIKTRSGAPVRLPVPCTCSSSILATTQEEDVGSRQMPNSTGDSS